MSFKRGFASVSVIVFRFNPFHILLETNEKYPRLSLFSVIEETAPIYIRIFYQVL